MADKMLLGWREWAGLPDLGIPRIRAKLDTGARTAALHATEIQELGDSGRRRVRFIVHPMRAHAQTGIQCEADVVDERFVTDSGGHRDRRLIIMTHLALGSRRWLIELSLTDRHSMRFRLLLGRSALTHRCVIDPSSCFRAEHGGAHDGAALQ
jgi:hypothetical protein